MESGLYQNWMRDYDPTTGRYMQADPLGLVAGASVYGYALQNPVMFNDPTGQCPWCIAAGAGAAAANFAYQYWKYDGHLECIDYWEVAEFGLLAGGGVGVGRNILATLLGRTRWGAGTAVNGLVGKPWTSLMSSMFYKTVSGRLRGVNGLIGSTKQLHHWAVSQSSQLGKYLGGRSWGRAILNSRLNLNPISGKLNNDIGARIFSIDNLLHGVPNWAKYGIPSIGLGSGALWGSGD